RDRFGAGADHEPEPRVRRRRGDAAAERPRDASLAVRRDAAGYRARRRAGVLVPGASRSEPGAARPAAAVPPVHRDDEGLPAPDRRRGGAMIAAGAFSAPPGNDARRRHRWPKRPVLTRRRVRRPELATRAALRARNAAESAASEVIALHAACAKSAAATVGVRERRTSPPSCRRRGLKAAATCRRIHGRDAAWKERVVRRALFQDRARLGWRARSLQGWIHGVPGKAHVARHAPSAPTPDSSMNAG